MYKGNFEINVYNANISKDLSYFGSMSPYFIVKLSQNNLYKSKECINEGKFPNWNDTFKLPYNGENNLIIEVLNKNTLVILIN
jgi:hypothetical protein